MGKKLKTGEATATTDKNSELLSIKKQQPKDKHQPLGSIFDNIKPTNKATSVNGASHTPVKSPDGLEDKILVKETIVEKAITPIIPETIVYEISYMDGKEEHVVYSKDLPTVSEKYLLNLSNAFGRSNLKELILGRREIKISCILPLANSDLVIDMRGGAFLKVVTEQDWMTREYDETKKLFDDAVLKAYREYAAQGVTALPPQQPNGKQPVGKQPQKQIQQQGEDYYPEGNITPDRSEIMGTF